MKEKKPFNVEVGQRVKQSRESAGLTQERFSELIGLGVKHISAIERGAVGVSLPTLKSICEILAIPADTLLFDPVNQDGQNIRDLEVRQITEKLSRLPEQEFQVVKEIMDKVLEAMALRQKNT